MSADAAPESIVLRGQSSLAGSGSCPAVTERAIQYDCLVRDGNRLAAPAGSRTAASSRPGPSMKPTYSAYQDLGASHFCYPVTDGTAVGMHSGLTDPEPLADYLQAVSELGDFGHLFTELHLTQARGIITIAPEWAAPDLDTLYGKMQKRERVNKALDLCRASDVNTVMPYFIIGAPTGP
ncbi:hypothetical protein [Streptomyces griseofuscus]|uniref:hypothetical protein n=1 Tax=Streptomyces griseofuscus TaxID=146922 RepID=UPI00167F6D29|nr:hypothetical protein [Streptomyces griseofuscus]